MRTLHISRSQKAMYRLFRSIHNSRIVRSSTVRSMVNRFRPRIAATSFETYQGDLQVELDGFELTIPNRYTEHYLFRDYEPITTRLIRQTLGPGQTFVDVGAHIGYFSVLAGKLVGSEGQVHAVEPSSDNLDYLKKNVLLNQLTNVHIHDCALGAKPSTAKLNITLASDSNSFYPHPLTETVKCIETKVNSLDNMGIEHIDIVKIDVEGAELAVIEGMRATIESNPNLILCVEWNPACMVNAGCHPASLPQTLRELRFSEIVVVDDYGRGFSDLDSTIALLSSSALPSHWYVNLWARKCTS